MDLLRCYDSSSSGDDSDGERGTVTTSSKKVLGIRQQPHVDGNWAGLCYFPVSEIIASSQRNEQIRRVCAELEMAGYSGHCQIHDEFHISLSRPFYLQEANLQPFVQALDRRIQESNVLQRFQVEIDCDNPIILTNDEETRSFLVWRSLANELLEGVRMCDELLSRYQQPQYYEDPEFHVSLASFVPAIGSRANRKVAQMLRDLCPQATDDDISAPIDRLCVKFGTTKVYELKLPP